MLRLETTQDIGGEVQTKYFYTLNDYCCVHLAGSVSIQCQFLESLLGACACIPHRKVKGRL